MALRRVAVAASGGRDSTALLHCTTRQAACLGIEVVALHVHHGLQAQASSWLEQVQRQARRWGAGFRAHHVLTSPGQGDSVEAWARKARYTALAGMARDAGCDLVLLAHHRRDQAETWLLQALRGAGAPGLSAMPRLAQRQGLTWARPWLDQSRAAIEAYVRRHRLSFVDDLSNGDPAYARNRLRLQVWPPLEAAFPDVEAVLTSAARQAQQATALALEVAALDLQAVQQVQALDLGVWLGLTSARRQNVLRAWLRTMLPAANVAESLIQRLLQELPAVSQGRWPAAGGELRLYRGRLCWTADSPAMVSPAPAVPKPAQRGCTNLERVRAGVDLSQPGTVDVPDWGGCFEVSTVTAGGIAPGYLHDAQLRVRSGGERFALGKTRPLRTLKKQYQALGVPEWERQGPLVFANSGELLYVPGLGMNAACVASAGQPQLSLRWLSPPGSTDRSRSRSKPAG